MIQIFVKSVGAMLIIGAIIAMGEYTALKQFGFEGAPSTNSYLRIAILTFCTYAGIAGQILASHLKKSKNEEIEIGAEIRRAMRSKEFWIAIVASPFILFAAYGAVEQVASLLLVAMISFQNGFFFHSVLSQQKA